MKEENQKIDGDKIPKKKFEVIEHGLLELTKQLNILENGGWEIEIHLMEKDNENDWYKVMYSKRMVRDEWE